MAALNRSAEMLIASIKKWIYHHWLMGGILWPGRGSV